MLGVLGSGREPSNSQASDALEALQDMTNLIVSQLSGPWIEQEITVDSTADEGDRIRVNSETPLTITVPISLYGVEREVDSCGCVHVVQVCNGERAPRDRAKIWITDVFGTIEPRLYLYRADIASWVLASALALDGYAPFGVAYKEGLAAGLAVRLSADTAQPLLPAVASMATQGALALLSGYDVPRNATPAQYF